MWALNLAIKTYWDTDNYEYYCGASSDAKYIVNTYYQQDESYGYSMYNYYVILYEVLEAGISQKKIFVQSSPDYPNYYCIVQNKNSSQVAIYMYSTASYLSIIRVKTPFDENGSEPSVSNQFYSGLLGMIEIENSNKEPLLYFYDHIQRIDESKSVDFNSSMLYSSETFARLDQNGDEEIYLIGHTFYQLFGVKLNFLGREDYTQIAESLISRNQTIYSFQTSHNEDFNFKIYISYDYDSEEMFVDDQFQKIETYFILKNNQYNFLQFSAFPDRLFLYYYHYDSYEICYCTYSYDEYQIKIDQTLGCYSVGIYTLDHILQMTAGEEDSITYLITNGMVIDSTRTDGNPEKLNDIELFFPNDAFSTDSSQLNSQNIKLISSEGNLVEIRKYYSDYSSAYYMQSITVESPTLAIHPGVIAGFVFAGLLVLALIGIAIFFFCRYIANNRNFSQASESPANQNNYNHQNTHQEVSQYQLKKKQSNPRMDRIIPHQDDEKAKKQVNQLAKRYGKDENCCICLSKGCDSYLPCMHFFHYTCIQNWAKSKSELHCPLCQQTTSLKDLSMI